MSINKNIAYTAAMGKKYYNKGASEREYERLMYI